MSNITMDEAVSGFLDSVEEADEKELVPLRDFRVAVTKHAKDKLERKFKWRKMGPELSGRAKLVRRATCKQCSAIKPSEATCGDHWGKARVQKRSYVAGFKLPSGVKIEATVVSPK